MNLGAWARIAPLCAVLAACDGQPTGPDLALAADARGASPPDGVTLIPSAQGLGFTAAEFVRGELERVAPVLAGHGAAAHAARAADRLGEALDRGAAGHAEATALVAALDALRGTVAGAALGPDIDGLRLAVAQLRFTRDGAATARVVTW